MAMSWAGDEVVAIICPIPTYGSFQDLPTPPRIYNKTSEAGRTVHCQTQNVCSYPPPPLLYQQESAEHALLEAALAPGMPSRLLQSYPCIGRCSLPSLSAASFKRAPLPDPASCSPPWPSKGPCCRCLW